MECKGCMVSDELPIIPCNSQESPHLFLCCRNRECLDCLHLGLLWFHNTIPRPCHFLLLRMWSPLNQPPSPAFTKHCYLARTLGSHMSPAMTIEASHPFLLDGQLLWSRRLLCHFNTAGTVFRHMPRLFSYVASLLWSGSPG